MNAFLSNKKLYKWSHFFLGMMALLATVHAHADGGAAEPVMRKLIESTSADLDKLYKENRIEDRTAIENLIRTDILPSVDQQRLTQRVFRQYWAQIVKANKQDEAKERVINALVRTYAVALSSYSGDTITLVSVNTQDNKATAKSRIRRPNGQTIQVDFNLANTSSDKESSGQWLVNDMAVDGIVISLTLFNSMKSVWDTQGMDAALASIATADVNKQQKKP